MLKYTNFFLGLVLTLGMTACNPSASDPEKAPAAQAEKPVSGEASDRAVRAERPRQGGGSGDGTRRAPPEIAYTACADLAVNAGCSFESRRGVRSGLCKIREGDERLLCVTARPDRQSRPRGGQNGQRPERQRQDSDRPQRN